MKDEEALASKLAFVRPERRALVERRIAVLERHRALAKPTLADAEHAATELNITVNSFYRLLSAWTARRDPKTVPGAGRPRRNTGHWPHPADEFVRETLDRLPRGRPHNRYVEAITAAAQEQGVDMMSASALKRLLRELVAEPPITGIFIDHCAVAIPVEGPSGPAMPIATVIGDGDGGRIAAAVLRMEPVSPASVIAVLQHALAKDVVTNSERRVVVHADAGLAGGWTALWSSIATHGIDRVGEDWRIIWGGRLGRSLMVPQLLGIASKPRFVTLPAERRPIGIHDDLDEVLSIKTAQAYIDDRIAASGSDARIALGDDPVALLETLRSL